MNSYYSTLREARNALALDAGYDVYLVHGGRCTIADLAMRGYIVDRAAAKAQDDARRERQIADVAESARRAADDARYAAQDRERDEDMRVMRGVADAVAATGAPVAHMDLYGDRTRGTVRLTYHDGRRPTMHRIDV